MHEILSLLRKKKLIAVWTVIVVVVMIVWLIVLLQGAMGRAGMFNVRPRKTPPPVKSSVFLSPPLYSLGLLLLQHAKYHFFAVLVCYSVARKDVVLTSRQAIPNPVKVPDLYVPCRPITDWKFTAKLPEHQIKPATIVYSFAIHHKFNHFKDWMDIMWEPQHFYIIHVDAKASTTFYKQIVEYAEGFPNVELSVERYNVVYYGWSVLWTHLHNFKRVIQLNQTRDYFINMAGADIPIKTPREINYFLGEHMGRSFMYEHCTWPFYRQWWRNYTWAEIHGNLEQVNNAARYEPPNMNLRWGQHYVILHRDVVEWMFSSPKIYHLMGWLQNVKSPDEMFYATMLHNSPFNGTKRVFTHNNFKYATWDKCCSGSILTAGHPCILGVCDFPKLQSLNHLFATKLDATLDAGLAPRIKKWLKEVSNQEFTSGKVKRIPLIPNMPLEPEHIEWREP